MQRYRLVIAYDGGCFHGCQAQAADVETVHGALAAACRSIAGGLPTVIAFAGRTDTGVHATGMVAHVDLPRRSRREVGGVIPPSTVRTAVNALLRRAGTSVSIRDCVVAPASFHARVSASARSYEYLIAVDAGTPRPHALHDQRMWTVPAEMDTGLLQQALSLFPGTHDFGAFRAKACRAEVSRRCVLECRVVHDTAACGAGALPASIGSGRVLCLRITANAFLYHQVRCMVGAAVAVALGHLSIEDVSAWLRGKTPEPASSDIRAAAIPHMAPACGLYFVDATYDDAAMVPLPAGSIYRPPVEGNTSEGHLDDEG